MRQRVFPTGSVGAASTEAGFPFWAIWPGSCGLDGVGEGSVAGELGRDVDPQTRPASGEVSPPGTVSRPTLLGQLRYLHVVVQVLGGLAHGAVAQHHHISRFARCM